jgi:hypothetical protein
MNMKPLSDKATKVLLWTLEGDTHKNCHGQSEHGGRQSILYALRRRDYIDSHYNVTEAGKALLRKEGLLTDSPEVHMYKNQFR